MHKKNENQQFDHRGPNEAYMLYLNFNGRKKKHPKNSKLQEENKRNQK